MRRRSFLQAALSGPLDCTLGHAQDAWPARPIRLIVPFAPGGSSEIIARSTVAEMEARLGRPMEVRNRPGGSGNVAMQECLNAGDDHVLVLGHIGTLAVNPSLFASLPYDVNRDFKPVCLLAKVPSVYVVNPRVPAANLQEFVALARKSPGRLNYGSAGKGSAGHLAMEYLKSEAGMLVKHVPYRGTGAQVADLLAGRLAGASVGAAAVLPFIRSGELRCIAIGSGDRIAQLPDVPTVEEQGYPGFEITQWYGLLAPRSLSDERCSRIAHAASAALKSAPVARHFAEEAVMAMGDGPARFGAFIATEQERWRRAVSRARIRLG